MNRRLFPALFALLALLLAAGCESIDSRIKQNPELFAKLDTATQEKIKQGIIDLGFTPDMVHLALGEPDQKRERRSAEGAEMVWVYSTYYERYDGTRFAGYHRRVYWDGVLNSYRVYYQPVFADTFRPETEERIRVVFRDGKVAVIEQAKN